MKPSILIYLYFVCNCRIRTSIKMRMR